MELENVKDADHDKIMLHVMVVAFHHKEGPLIEYCYPPLPNSGYQPIGKSVLLPDDWSYLGFICLPDGAHLAAEEEFIYFHLPPVPNWAGYERTLFGLACFRQIDSTQLLVRSSDITRTKVQKSVVILSNQAVLSSVRNKLAIVTKAFFEQRDFSKVDLIDNLYANLDTNLRMPISDAQLFMGLGLREVIYKFKHKALQLFKLLFLGKRVMFFGQKVERLSVFQYTLISLYPELLRNLHDVGLSKMQNFPLAAGKVQSGDEQIDLHKARLLKLGHPLRLFGANAFFQPYIPLQQIDVLESSDTQTFLAGTSNSVFTHNKSCHIDVIVNTDTGNLEILNPSINPLIALTSADKSFIDTLLKTISTNWSPETHVQQIDFQGSDDDIRSKFEAYITQLFASMHYDQNTPPSEPGTNYLGDYNMVWVNEWKKTANYKIWLASRDSNYVITPGHPNHGASSILDSFTASLTAFSKNLTTTPGTDMAIEEMSSPSQLLSSVSSWYSLKRSQWTATPDNDDEESKAVKEELRKIQQLMSEARVKE